MIVYTAKVAVFNVMTFFMPNALQGEAVEFSPPRMTHSVANRNI